MRLVSGLRSSAGVVLLAGAAHAGVGGFFVSAGDLPGGESGYYAHTATGVHHVDPTEIMHGAAAAVRMRLSGARSHVVAEPAQPLSAAINYLNGDDPNGWRRGLTAYRSLRYREIYPGIDLICSGGSARVRTTFSLAPGADSALIQVSFSGAGSVSVDTLGSLSVETPDGVLNGSPPQAYQEIMGRRWPVAVSLEMRSPMALSLRLGAYNTNQSLIVDPGLWLSSYLGGSGFDNATAIAVDAAGNTYLAGWTDSTDLRTVNPLRAANARGVDAFVAKIGADGTLIYCTYLGGSGDDRAFAIAVDAAGSAYVAGATTSANFPVAGAIQLRLAGGKDGFLVKLTPAGNNLIFSTYLGGTGPDSINAIAVDASGNVYVAGETGSADLPRTSGYRAYAGQTDAFVAKVVPAGNALAYLTYLGGSSEDRALGLAIDGSGNAFVTGSTWSLDFPITAGAAQTASGGNQDAFITKLNSSGSVLLYSTFLGGSGGTLGYPEIGSSIAVDGTGSAFVTGTTGSPNFPLVNAMQPARIGISTDAFLTKLNSSGSAFVYSTYLGGSGPDFGTAVALDSSGQAYVTGYTISTDFPTVRPLQAALGGSYDAFLSAFSADGGTLIQSTYLGGSESDAAAAIAVTASGIYIAGQTGSLNFPLVAAFQTGMAGAFDAFLSVVKPLAPACTVTVSPSSVTAKSYAASASIAITASAGCSWTAASTSGWIGVANPTGTGSATLSINIAANVGVARAGAITVAGQTLAVSQSSGLVSANFDVNHDGRIDLFWQNPSGESQVWFLGGASGTSYLGGVLISGPSNSRIAAIADLDGDGNPDIVWQDPVTGATDVWLMGGVQGNMVLSTVALTAANPWRIVASGDFDGDGRADLVWQDPVTGQAQIWFIGGSSSTLRLVGAANLTNSNQWRIAGAGDFNHDGRPDLVWQDRATGATQVWFLGGALGNVVMGAANLTLGNNWRIAAVADFKQRRPARRGVAGPSIRDEPGVVARRRAGYDHSRHTGPLRSKHVANYRPKMTHSAQTRGE